MVHYLLLSRLNWAGRDKICASGMLAAYLRKAGNLPAARCSGIDGGLGICWILWCHQQRLQPSLKSLYDFTLGWSVLLSKAPPEGYLRWACLRNVAPTFVYTPSSRTSNFYCPTLHTNSGTTWQKVRLVAPQRGMLMRVLQSLLELNCQKISLWTHEAKSNRTYFKARNAWGHTAGPSCALIAFFLLHGRN